MFRGTVLSSGLVPVSRLPFGLYALAVSDLAKITSHILMEASDLYEMAEMIYSAYSSRMIARAFVMRLVLHATADYDKPSKHDVAALRLQMHWVRYLSRRVFRNHTGDEQVPYEMLMPVLFGVLSAPSPVDKRSRRGSVLSRSGALPGILDQADSFNNRRLEGQSLNHGRRADVEGGDSFNSRRPDEMRRSFDRLEESQKQLQAQVRALSEAEASREERLRQVVLDAVSDALRGATGRKEGWGASFKVRPQSALAAVPLPAPPSIAIPGNRDQYGA